MSKTQVPPAKNIAKKQAIAVKKVPVKADSKAIKKSKSAVPVMSSQGSSSEEGKKKTKKSEVPTSQKTAQVKKAVASKENQKPDTVQPKKPTTTYFAFLAQRREQFRNDNPTLSITEIAKGLGKVWSALNDDQKKPFLKIVEQDIVRYQAELKMLNTKGYFINKDGVNSKDLQKEVDKKKATQSGVQPKKPLSAYMCYMTEMQALIRSKNPDLKMTEISTQIGQQWGQIKDNEKTKWNNIAAKDRTRYEKELNQLQTKGFFVNSNGIKSTDIVQKKFKYPEGTVMPKRPAQAYQIYVRENKEKIVEKNNCSKEEAKQICDQVWQKLSDKQKMKYNNLHAADIKRYEKQVIQIQTKGYFELEVGSKSQ